MSTSSVVRLGFRCTKCWQLTCAQSDQTGQSVPCIHCSTPVTVPAADERTIKAGEEFADANPEEATLTIDFDQELSEKEIYEIARDKVKKEMKESGSIAALTASRMRRFLASIVDSIAFLATLMLCVGVFFVMGGQEGGIPVMIASVTPIFMLGIIQLYLLAAEGRSIGKYCLGTKIVRNDGTPPGFFQGIVMRVVAVSFLGMIPFFHFFDALFIFYNDSNRCIHDYVAGTYVIMAR